MMWVASEDRAICPQACRPIRFYGSGDARRAASVRQLIDRDVVGVGVFFAAKHFAETMGVRAQHLRDDVVFRALKLKNPSRDGCVEVEVNTLDQDGVHVNPSDGVLDRCQINLLETGLASMRRREPLPDGREVSPNVRVRRPHSEGRFLETNRPSHTTHRAIGDSSQIRDFRRSFPFCPLFVQGDA